MKTSVRVDSVAGRSPRSATAIDLSVGARLRLRRRICNLSQEELAARAQVSAQMIQKYEQGEARISASRLADMARILAVPPGWFFEDSRSDSPPAEVPDVLNAEGAEVVALLNGVEHLHVRRKIVAVVRLLVSMDEQSKHLPSVVLPAEARSAAREQGGSELGRQRVPRNAK